MNLDVRSRQGETFGANVRAVWQPGILLFHLGPEPKPAELQEDLVLKVSVPASPCPSTTAAGMSVVALGVNPPAGAASAAAMAPARAARRNERKTKTEPTKGSILPIEEA